MDMSKLCRMKMVECNISALQSYVFAFRYGYDFHRVRQLGNAIDTDFLGFRDGSIHQLEGIVNRVEEEILEHWEKRTAAILKELQTYPPYQQMCEAYRKNDQQAIAQHAEAVFHVIPITKPCAMYHGVYPRKQARGICGIDFPNEWPSKEDHITPDEYIDRLQTIQTSGLLPSEGMHATIDQNIRAVFMVDNHKETYGLLFVEMNPVEHNYSLFQPEYGDYYEFVVYTPQLTIPMKLCLKSAEYTHQYLEENGIRKKEQEGIISYRHAVEQRLRKRGIPFTLIEPEYIKKLREAEK